MILAHDFSGLAPMSCAVEPQTTCGVIYLGGGTDFCRLMTGAKSMQNFVSNLPDHC